MSLSSTNARNNFTSAGTTSSFQYTFKVFSEDDLLVMVQDTAGVEYTLVKTSDYTVSGVGESGGGSITLVDSGQAWLDSDGDLILDWKISIIRNMDLKQQTDFRNQSEFFAENHEDQFDKQVMLDQRLEDQVSRAAKMKETSTTTAPRLPEPSTGQALIWGSDGNLENTTNSPGNLAGESDLITAISATVGSDNALAVIKTRSDGFLDHSFLRRRNESQVITGAGTMSSLEPFVLCQVSSTTYTITLPSDSVSENGATFTFIKTSLNTTYQIRIHPNSGQSIIDGIVNYGAVIDVELRMPGDSITLVKDSSSNWRIVHDNTGRQLETVTGVTTVSEFQNKILADATSGSYNVTLPNPGNIKGRKFFIQKVDSSTNTVNVYNALGIGAENPFSDFIYLTKQDDYIEVQADYNADSYRIIGSKFTDRRASYFSQVAWPITGAQWGDLTSLTLPPGRWRIYGMAYFVNIGAATLQTVFAGYGSATGNDSTGFFVAKTGAASRLSASSNDLHVVSWENDTFLDLSATTTIYMKGYLTTTTNVEVQGYIGATKIL